MSRTNSREISIATESTSRIVGARARGLVRFGAALLSTLAVVMVTSNAAAAADSPRWPQALPRLVHWFVAGDASSCTRSDLDVGGAGFCGELSSGADVAFGRAFRFDVEQGIGVMNRVTVGNAAPGLRTGSGGVFLGLRALVGYDVTSFFFVRAGGQLRFTDSLATVAWGPQAVVDMGTRVGDRVELGSRAFVGTDGVIVTGKMETRSYQAPTFGAGLLVRVFIL